ncbi:MAG TPA: glycosyltransferase family 39 protein [Thermoanaerobaculia bacterium]|nr:glycosyltransferase family 39 protein [Thermoanaerobaculia bacterium]
MFLVDLLGAGLTLLTLLFLFLSGYLLARMLLGRRAEEDPLLFAITALLLTTAEAVLLGLLLGALGLLRTDLALPLLIGITLIPLLKARRSNQDLWSPALILGRRAWDRVREHPVLYLIAAHAVFAEGLRALLRPPLSWDSLMYHLLITATWVQEQAIAPIFGMHPTYFYGYQPANGSVWLWWWMAPSHSELYANLAFFPQTFLLALAAGGVARELGARRHWPLASLFTLLLPVVIRFTATQYVDIFMGAAFAAAAFFALRWMREPRWSDAVLAGMGMGLAAGTKVLGIPFALALGLVVLLARGSWGRRVPQLGAALLALVLLGGFFYARNTLEGAGPLAARCEGTPGAATASAIPTIPRINTVAYMIPRDQLTWDVVLDVFLGVPRPGSEEIGIGPQLLLLLPVFLLPWLLPKEVRRGAILVWSQVVIHLVVWTVVPYASHWHVFANVRYLDGILALMFAGAVALGERHLPDPTIRVLALLFCIQDLLMLHTDMTRTVRLALGLADLGLVVWALSPGFRSFTRRRIREIAVAGLALVLLAAPALARYRVQDRSRAFRMEYTTHKISAFLWAPAYGWLDKKGEDGTVAVIGAPSNFFIYPVMGTRLERRAVYVNVNRKDSRKATDYPGCDPRVDPDPQAWMENLYKQNARWVYLHRYPQLDFPMEQEWIDSRPDLFKPRFQNNTSRVYEFLPVSSRR